MTNGRGFLRTTRSRQVLLIVLSLLPLTAAFFWIRSHYVGDRFWQRYYIARWPEGTEKAVFPSYFRLSHPGKEMPIYTMKEIQFGSAAGGIYFDGSKLIFDLRSNQDFSLFAPDTMGLWTGHPIDDAHTHFYRRSDQPIAYPQLDSTGNHKPTWDFRYSSQGNSKWFAFVIPYWSVTLLTSIPLILMLAVFIRRRYQLHHNKCLSCGYDLRATPDRCPECGHIPAKSVTNHSA
jgi:hypothetical protein